MGGIDGGLGGLIKILYTCVEFSMNKEKVTSRDHANLEGTETINKAKRILKLLGPKLRSALCIFVYPGIFVP